MINLEFGNRHEKAGAMANRDVRDTLEKLIRSSGDGYAAVSRLVGRNPAYIQQFIKRGVPRRLSESDRRTIARHFGVSESLLGGPGAPARSSSKATAGLQPEGLSMGHHATVPYLSGRSVPLQALVVDHQFLQSVNGGRLPTISALAIDSDAMAPTLIMGDHILVDTTDTRSPRDGIYVIESDGALLVKRLAVHPVTHRIAVLSDNAAYPSFPDCDPAGVQIVGRVFWVGRRLP